MTSKFVFKLFLILFTVITNSFCIENQIQKRFGCHNLSSINKIADMNSNTNELWRNLERCMRDTGTYNKENLNIAQKLQNDFKSIEKNSWSNILFILFDTWFLTCIGTSGGLLIYSCEKKNIGLTLAGLSSTTVFTAGRHFFYTKYVANYKIDSKKIVAEDTKKFVATLPKNNS